MPNERFSYFLPGLCLINATRTHLEKNISSYRTKKIYGSTMFPLSDFDMIWCLDMIYMAEREGFEPPEGINLQWFSRPSQSTRLCHLS